MKNIKIAIRVPRWRIASRANPWSLKLSTKGARMRCPELDTGKNSVKPWIIPNNIIWNSSMCLMNPKLEAEYLERSERLRVKSIHFVKEWLFFNFTQFLWFSLERNHETQMIRVGYRQILLLAKGLNQGKRNCQRH